MTNMTEFYSRIYWLNKSDSLTTPLGKTNLNHMDSAIKTLDGRTVELYTEAVRLDTTKANKEQLKGMLVNWQVDEATGIVTLTKYDGTKISINTALNQLAVNFDYDAVNQQLIITQTDGTQKIVDMSALITEYEFLDTDTVSFFVDENGKVSAKVKEGSIEEKHLQPNYLADVKVEVAKVQGYAADAQESADNAAYDAKLSQSYAIGGSGIRENEDADNAREYAKKAKESADTAQELVGGKFIPVDEKGAAEGVATLDEEGKVPKEQLPDLAIDSKSITLTTYGSSLNLDFNNEKYKGRLFYMLATSSTTEGKPPSNAMIIGLGWNGSGYGAELGIGIGGENLWLRGRKTNGSYTDWLEFINAKNIGSYLEDIGGGGSSNTSKALLETLSSNADINFENEDFSERYTWSITDVSDENDELLSASVLNFGYNIRNGIQFAITLDASKALMRAYNEFNGYSKWLEFLTTGNISSDGHISNANDLPVDYRIPFSGTPYGEVNDSYANLYEFCKVHKGGFYTVLFSGKWYDVISLRHRNGYGDGKNYGLIIYAAMSNDIGDLVWGRQSGDNNYEQVRTLLDTKNYSSYIGSLRDKTNGNPIYLNYTASAITPDATRPWLALWINNGDNTYDLKTTNIANFIQAKMANGYYGMCAGAYADNTWIRTTSLGLLPYQAGGRGSGHQQLGTDSWYFLRSYIDRMFGVSLDLSGAITSNSVTTNSELIKGNLRLQNGNYGQKINFGDGEYVYLHEDIDDHLKIYAKAGAEINCANTYYIKIGIMTVDTANGYKGTKLYAGGGVSVPNFTPIHDIGCTLGAPSYRWNGIYSRDSSISTSDRTEKKEVSYIGKSSDYDTYMDDETLKSFISGLLPVIYKRINGESGRPHHGFIAQDVEKLMQELNIKDHAGFIKSPKTETIEIEEETEEEYTDEVDGQVKIRIVTQKREEQREIPGEYTYGLRYEEFIADIVRFVQLQDERIEEQEKIIYEQQKELDNQREEISALKARLERLEALLLY